MTRLVAGIVALVVTLLVIAPGPAVAGTHTSEEFGFKVGVPAKWDEIPVKLEERWIVARFLCQKEYRIADSGGWTSTFKPEMRVIVFPFAVTKGDGEQEVEIEVGGTVVFRNFNNPYKDYEDYLKRTYSGGGWYISMKEEKKGRGFTWTLLEIKVEKLARSGKKRLVAGVFHVDDADFVVQFEVLEDTYRKLKGTMYRTLNSFAFIPRKGTLAPATTEGPRIRTPGDDEEELSPELRRQRRDARQKSAYEKLASRLPRGWSHFKYKDYFYVLTHVDKKYTRMVCKHGENVWKWLDKNFPDVGEDQPRPIIVRICADREEESAYHGGGGGSIWFFSSGSEVVLSKGDGRDMIFSNSPFGELNSRILSNWMQDKDSALYWAMPSWLRGGLRDLVDSAWTQKSGRLEFAPDIGMRRSLAIAASKGELRKIQDVLTLSRDEIGNAYRSQTTSIIRFLLAGPGRRSSGGKEFLPRYFDAVRTYAKEREEKEKAEVQMVEPKKEPETEEEEEEMLKRRRERRGDWEERELEHLSAIFDLAFGDWADRNWRGLEGLYRKWLVSR